nr:hypothetical protein [Tanacetum cinerariifolium]
MSPGKTLHRGKMANVVVNLTSKSIHGTSMGEQAEESDTEVEDIDGDAIRFMASLSNSAGEGANDASLLEDEDYDIFWLRV